MPIVGVVNQKGGCGKSTLTVHFARWLQQCGSRVQVVDADGQQTPSDWLARLASPIPCQVVEQAYELQELLPTLTEESGWVVIDGPATVLEMNWAIAAVCDLVVVPCQPTGIDLASLSQAVDLLSQIQQIRQLKPRSVVFINRAVSGTRLEQQAIATLAQQSTLKRLDVVVYQRQVIADAFSQGTTVFDQSGKAARLASKEYDRLFTQLVTLCAD